MQATEGHAYESAEKYEDMRAAFQRNCLLYRYEELPGTHHLHLIHPDSVAQVINPFLAAMKSLISPSLLSNTAECEVTLSEISPETENDRNHL